MIHLLGIFLVLASLAGLAIYTANGGTKSKNVMRKQVAIAHGVGLFLILLGGFGMLARLGIVSSLPGWVWVKIGTWIVFGALFAVVSKKPTVAKAFWLVVPFLALLSAYFAIIKPI